MYAIRSYYVNKGVTIFDQGDPEGSLKYFDEALLIEPERIGALVNKANALQELKRTNEAYDFVITSYSIHYTKLYEFEKLEEVVTTYA